MIDKKQLILNTVSDLVTDLLYYDRKEDEDLPRGTIETAVSIHEIMIEDMVQQFRNDLIDSIYGESVDE